MKKPDHIKKNIYTSLENTCIGSESILVGLTGGIATGKSTVAEIFRTLGAVIIDFDILARRVVEPGTKSYELITDFFGKEILNHDLTIDRKRLSGIVFNDQAKREKLESFTHPFIWDQFIALTGDAVSHDNKAIILAVVPLLIEGGMQDIFQKIFLVYSSPEKQMLRLMKRDGISKEMAYKIINAQMPINNKISFADFIIHNDSTLDVAEKEAQMIWNELIQLQKQNHIHCKLKI
jgi:dephospho-CoA kinase